MRQKKRRDKHGSKQKHTQTGEEEIAHGGDWRKRMQRMWRYRSPITGDKEQLDIHLRV